MMPILFLCLLSNIGEPMAPRIAAIEQKARLFPPKRSPWHGTGDAAMKVTLWNGNGTLAPQKLKVDATLGNGGRVRDFYWFEAGKATYATQIRWTGQEAVERRLVFATGHVVKAQERRAASEPALARAAFSDVGTGEVAKLDQDVAALLKECLRAPGIRDRKAKVKAVEQSRVVLETAPGVEAWIQRRQGDNVAATLVGRQVTYDFTAVEENGRETDYLNGIRPAGVSTVLASAPAAAAVAPADPAAPVVKTEPVAKKAPVAKKKPVRKKTRARKKI